MNDTLRVEHGKLKKLLTFVIGFLTPVTMGGAAIDILPKWVLVAVACTHSGCWALFSYVLKPPAEGDSGVSPDTFLPPALTGKKLDPDGS